MPPGARTTPDTHTDPDAATDTAPTPRVRTEPPTPSFTDAAAHHFAAISDAARRTRAALGLPTDRPVVMTGHQPTFFHPGILAKYHAARAIADAADGAAAAIIVAHDTADPFALAAPDADEFGLPEPVEIALAPPTAGARTASHRCAQFGAGKPPFEPGNAPKDADARAALDRAVRTVTAHADAPNAALQIARANADLTGAHDRITPITTDDLAAAEIFRDAAHHMANNPRTLHAYNDACRAHPDAGVTPLDLTDAHNPELPLWKIDREGRRARAHAKDLGAEPGAHDLRPRALLMTALLRTAACDLFIHGTGGFAYDRITTEWLARDAPLPDRYAADTRHPAQTCMVTADLPLPGEPAEPVSDADAHAARWRAHHARHHPAMTGDDALQRRRDELAASIAAASDRRERSARFRALHAFLDGYRRSHADAIAALDRDAARLERIAARRRSGTARRFPAFFHPASSLERLERAVRAAVLG
jgi:hypothetical protein